MKGKNFYTLVISESEDIISEDELKGKLLMIVNVTICDAKTTSIFDALTKLNKKYRDQGLRILSFPCFQFGMKKTRDDLIKFVKDNNFDIGYIMKEIEVNGSKTCPLYVHLKEKMPSRQGFLITENFTYFFADRRGKIVQRLPSSATYHELDDMVYQLL